MAKPTIQTERVYETPTERDGRRVLVDRVWPRGVSKHEARVDRWMKEVAPRTALRKWFNHDPNKWQDFKRAYFQELDEHRETLRELLRETGGGTLTLVYAAKDTRHNNAEALKQYLNRLKR